MERDRAGSIVTGGGATTAEGRGEPNPRVRAGRSGRRGLALALAAVLGVSGLPRPLPASEPVSGSVSASAPAPSGAADPGPGERADDPAPSPSCSDPETRATTLRCFPRLLLHDAREVFGAPAHWGGRQWTIFSAEVLAVGAMTFADKQVRKNALPEQGTPAGQLAKDVEPLGGWASFAVLGGFYGGGAIAGDDKAKGVAIDGLIASAIASGVITTSLKYVVGRSRPNAGKGVYHFRPFSGDVSFPSGHATQAFAVASVIATEYKSAWVQVAAYGPALLVGFARLRHDAHWASDVTAGALIGIGVGRAVARLDVPLRSRGSAHHAMVVPLIGPHEQGVVVIASFK
jgi:membrane-associated phospholipid phosphatase